MKADGVMVTDKQVLKWLKCLNDHARYLKFQMTTFTSVLVTDGRDETVYSTARFGFGSGCTLRT